MFDHSDGSGQKDKERIPYSDGRDVSQFSDVLPYMGQIPQDGENEQYVALFF